MDNITILNSSVLLIDEYYDLESQVELPPNFFSKIVEYENAIFINEDYEYVRISELASLYKVLLRWYL